VDPTSPSLKGHSPPPQFSANVRCGQTTGWTKMALGMEVGLGPGDFVYDGDPANPSTEGTPTTTQFLAHVYCGQTAEWMKTPLGTEVDLSPGHTVLDGVPALPETGRAAPHLFGPCLLWPRSPISATAERLLMSFNKLQRFTYISIKQSFKSNSHNTICHKQTRNRIKKLKITHHKL